MQTEGLDLEVVKERLGDKRWRLNNLYKIRDVSGREIQFEMNSAQTMLFDNLWYYNVVLKARQLGFSTFILIYILDHCLFEDNQACGVIAHNLNDAEDLFRNKVKFAYDNLPEWLKKLRTFSSNSARELVFNNGSSIVVGTSLRSGTFQRLHVSEFGKISAKYPDKAKEIVSGALNTIHPGQITFIESTAEGRSGEFYEMCMRAIRLEEQKSNLTVLDPKIHFFPWWKNPINRLPSTVSINAELKTYFDDLQAKGIILEPDQKSWYVKKNEQMMDRLLMKREHPSTWAECFEASMEGAFYTQAMSALRKNGQITSVPYNPAFKVDTFWDIGLNDKMCIWFMQNIHGRKCFIDFYQNANEGLGHYADVLNRRGYTYGMHYLPHDGNRRQVGENIKTTRKIAEQLGIRPTTVVPRTRNVLDDIQEVRTVIPTCWFDEGKCSEGLAGLDGYRKQWNDKLGEWSDTPYHDGNSDVADAFRTFVKGYRDYEHPWIEDLPSSVPITENVLD